MKILHVVDYLMPTMGYQEFILPKFNAIDHKNEVYILTGNKYYPVPNYNSTWLKFLGDREFEAKNELIDNVNIIREKILFEISNRPWILNLEKNIKKIRPNVLMVHGTTSFSAYRVTKIAKKLNIPVFLDNHMVFSVVKKNIFGFFFYYFVKNFFSKYVSKRASKIFGVTQETCDYLVLKEGYQKEIVELLPLGVDTTTFYPIKKKIKKDYFEIIQTGKLNKDKAPNLLASAVTKLISEGYKINLTYYGDGDEDIMNNIKNMFEKKKISHLLKFEPFVQYKNLGKVFNDCDLCVFPYGTSLSAIECAFCDTPVIMTDDKASLEREKDGLGICYKTGDIDDLSEKIKHVMNRDLETSQVQLKSEKIVNKYDYNKISEQFIEICKKYSKS